MPKHSDATLSSDTLKTRSYRKLDLLLIFILFYCQTNFDPSGFSDDVVVLCASGTAAQGNLSMMLDLEAVGIYGPPFIPATSLAPSALHPPKQQPLLTKANNNKAQPGTATNQLFIYFLLA